MHFEIDKLALNLWKRTWNEVIGCRQTRHFYPQGPRPRFSKSLFTLPKPIVWQLVQILTGHTYLKRHQAVIDESERQRCLEALNWDNADDDGNAIIDAADPLCSRCNVGEETPLHLLTECDRLATLRVQIFGKEKLVEPGAIPDFSDIPIYLLVSFFREAKFEALSMQPFRAQYLPTNTSNEESNKGLLEEKQEGDLKAVEWASKYLYRIPLKEGRKPPKISKSDDEDDQSGTNSADSNVIQPQPFI